jgi:hypothetical protein
MPSLQMAQTRCGVLDGWLPRLTTGGCREAGPGESDHCDLSQSWLAAPMRRPGLSFKFAGRARSDVWQDLPRPSRRHAGSACLAGSSGSTSALHDGHILCIVGSSLIHS